MLDSLQRGVVSVNADDQYRVIIPMQQSCYRTVISASDGVDGGGF